MAEATAEAVPALAPKSAVVGTLLNSAGMFAASLIAVVAGGFINAQLHHPPDVVDWPPMESEK